MLLNQSWFTRVLRSERLCGWSCEEGGGASVGKCWRCCKSCLAFEYNQKVPPALPQAALTTQVRETIHSGVAKGALLVEVGVVEKAK